MGKKRAVVELHILNTVRGHKKEVVTIEDDNPENRAKLAEKITALIKDGFVIKLSDGTAVKGYDPASNEWLVPAAGKKKGLWDRVKGVGASANAVAPVAGG
jgi:hypothetical protein